MDQKNEFKAELTVPFPSNRIAEIVYHVMRVDSEPKRSGVEKHLTLSENNINITFVAPSAKQARVSVSSFFEGLKLVTETISVIGEPVSEKYDHFI